MTRRWDWLNQAACAGDPDPVWIQDPARSTTAQLDRARSTCLHCPVVARCWAHHMGQPMFEGFAAGRVREFHN